MDTTSTIGADYKSQIRKIEGENVEVELWDTSGQDRYRSVAKNFFRGSDGVFIVFSLAEDKSLKALEYWIEQVKEILDPSVPKILIGNKADLKKEPSP
jgi:small GTP-binding protein